VRLGLLGDLGGAGVVLREQRDTAELTVQHALERAVYSPVCSPLSFMPSGCRPKTTQLASGAGVVPETSSTRSSVSWPPVSSCAQPAGSGSASSEIVGFSGFRLLRAMGTFAAAARAGLRSPEAAMTASAMRRAMNSKKRRSNTSWNAQAPHVVEE
jgi:hypothetical protein